MQAEIARQARARPLVYVPEDTLRVTFRLLVDLRRFVARFARTRFIPKLRAPVQFSALALLLGDVQTRFKDFGDRFHVSGPLPGSTRAAVAAAEADLLHLIAGATNRIRTKRDM